MKYLIHKLQQWRSHIILSFVQIARGPCRVLRLSVGDRPATRLKMVQFDFSALRCCESDTRSAETVLGHEPVDLPRASVLPCRLGWWVEAMVPHQPQDHEGEQPKLLTVLDTNNPSVFHFCCQLITRDIQHFIMK